MAALATVLLLLTAQPAVATTSVGMAAGPDIGWLQFDVYGNDGTVDHVSLVGFPIPKGSVCGYSARVRFNEPGGGNSEYSIYGTSGRKGCSWTPFISRDIGRTFPLGTYVCGTFYVWDRSKNEGERQETPDGTQQAPEKCIKLKKGFW